MMRMKNLKAFILVFHQGSYQHTKKMTSIVLRRKIQTSLKYDAIMMKSEN
jgi:hypothetical protein